jgi:hypothetical protein
VQEPAHDIFVRKGKHFLKKELQLSKYLHVQIKVRTGTGTVYRTYPNGKLIFFFVDPNPTKHLSDPEH